MSEEMSENTGQGQQYGTSQQGAPSQPQGTPFQQMPSHPRDDVPEYQPQQQQERPHEYERTAQGEQPRDTSGEYVRADDVDRIIEKRLAERDRKHEEETAKLRAQVPSLVVPMHGGGPGNDNHRVSWNLAEQEAAKRGEHLDHWDED